MVIYLFQLCKLKTDLDVVFYVETGLIGPAIALLSLGLIGEPNRGEAIGLLILAVGINSAIYSGTEVNHIDISPRFAATLMGITNGLGNVFALVAPLIVQYIVTDEVRLNNPQIIFILLICFTDKCNRMEDSILYSSWCLLGM